MKRLSVSLVARALGWGGLGLLLLAILLSDFLAQDSVLTGPVLSPPGGGHLFGTDVLGRDMLGETLHGLAETGRRAALAALVAILLGGVFGAVAARFPHPLALCLRSVFRVLCAIPALLLTILMIGLFGRSFGPFAAGLAAAPLGFVRNFDRVNRTAPHTEYAYASGISGLTLLQRDLTYDVRALLGSLMARTLAAVTIILSTASFLGFGAEPRDLGLMIAAAKTSYLVDWWTVLFPGLALVALVLCARLAAGLDEGEDA